MQIDLKNIFLPIYLEKFVNNTQYYNILYGGRAGGKSVAIAQKLVYRCIQERNHTFLILRNMMIDHAKSTYIEITNAINDFGLTAYAEFKKVPLQINIPELNCKFLFLGLDDPQRLKSLSGITGVWWEEISEVDSLEIFDEVMAGFRPNPTKVKYPQVYISFNPMSVDHWVKKRFFDDNIDQDRTLILKVNYLVNPHLSGDYIRSLLNLKHTNPHLYNIYVLGEWGRVQTGGEFYKNFSYDAHVDVACERAVYNPNLPLHISFDFNIMPGYTLLLCQVDLNTRTVLVVDEMMAKHPRNTAYGICDMFKERYGNHQAGLYIYGDPAGQNRHSVGRTHENEYNIIDRELAEFHPVFRLDKAHPRVNIRAQWINQIFALNLDGIAVIVNPMCNNLLMDFQEMKEDENGGKKKDKNMYVNGVRCEKYGHASDAFDYFMTKCFESEWLKFSKGSRNGGNEIFTFRPRGLRNLY